MKANELRIGNLLLFENEVQELSSIHSDNTIRLRKTKEDNCHGCYHVNTIIIKPIPLTEEWLLKFGFEKAYETCYQYKDFILNDKFIMMDIDITIQLKHVHQLQNLYFALTGEEL